MAGVKLFSIGHSVNKINTETDSTFVLVFFLSKSISPDNIYKYLHALQDGATVFAKCNKTEKRQDNVIF